MWLAPLLLIPLIYTVPDHNQYRGVNADGDSVILCDGGGIASDLYEAKLHRQSVIGGPYITEQTHNIRFKEGQLDTFWIDPGPGAHFCVSTLDIWNNESCWGNIVYVPGSVTAVETPLVGDKLIKSQWYGLLGPVN